MKVLNGSMVRIHLDRAKNGKKFNDLFLQRMKNYEKKKAATNNKHGVEAAASHEDRDDFILSNFNIDSYMEWYKENNHHDDSNNNEDDSKNKDDNSNSNLATPYVQYLLLKNKDE
jgi:hypothetical protein